jgi:hypothetical protein
MKTLGIEGKALEQVRAGVAPGGSFVAYRWNASLRVVRFRRQTDIYQVAPGENAAARGLPRTWLSPASNSDAMAPRAAQGSVGTGRRRGTIAPGTAQTPC